jgi:hypothetical protein
MLLKQEEPESIWTGAALLNGRLSVPRDAHAVILIPGLAGTFRYPSIRAMSAGLTEDEFAVLAVDLLTVEEQHLDERTGHIRVDVDFLAARLAALGEWIARNGWTRGLPLAILTASATASAAIVAATSRKLQPFAMALVAPRIDLLQRELPQMNVPTLLFIDDAPHSLAGLRRRFAMAGAVEIIPGVKLLEDEVTAQFAARESANWFRRHALAAR